MLLVLPQKFIWELFFDFLVLKQLKSDLLVSGQESNIARRKLQTREGHLSPAPDPTNKLKPIVIIFRQDNYFHASARMEMMTNNNKYIKIVNVTY